MQQARRARCNASASRWLLALGLLVILMQATARWPQARTVSLQMTQVCTAHGMVSVVLPGPPAQSAPGAHECCRDCVLNTPAPPALHAIAVPPAPTWGLLSSAVSTSITPPRYLRHPARAPPHA
ncbi:MAG: hypothetical protein IPH08_18460 [Rhodocyclaceae bacterium]|jgi:hypothetical protein|nr:hypothetical protein [Rhodocyclaceae bacterium]MBK6908982.1 hypothetical protein [Rhodocyclaceae bacterium]